MNLLNKCYDHFSSFIKFSSSERNTENTISDLYFNEKSDYSEENTSDNEVFCSTILQPFQFEPEQKKVQYNESHEKETKHIRVSPADLLHIGVGNLDWNESHDKKTKHVHASAADLLHIRIGNLN